MLKIKWTNKMSNSEVLNKKQGDMESNSEKNGQSDRA